MLIEFESYAWETFQRIVDALDPFGCTVWTLDGEKIEGYIRGADYQAEWGDAVLIEDNKGNWSHFPGDGDTRSVRVKRIQIH